MNQPIDRCEHIRLTLIANATALQHCTKTEGTEVLIPATRTGKSMRILIGTDEYLARMALPAPATTASIDLAQLDKLEALARGAKANTWTAVKHSWANIGIYSGSRPVACLSIIDDAMEETQDALEAEMDEDAAFMVAACNALPSLIALARRSLTSGAPAEPARTELDGWNAAAKSLAERAAGHYRNKSYDLQDECLQCAAMLHDMKPSKPVHDAAAKSEQALPPVVCVGRPFPTTDKATIHFARDVTDDELLLVNEVLRSRLNRPAATAAGAGSAQPRAEGDERALFEAKYRTMVSDPDAPHVLARDESGLYESGIACGMWTIWQARAALDQAAQSATTASASPEHATQLATQEHATLAAPIAQQAASQPAPTCAMCNDSGIVGFPPDQYEECPDCIKARAAQRAATEHDHSEGGHG